MKTDVTIQTPITDKTKTVNGNSTSPNAPGTADNPVVYESPVSMDRSVPTKLILALFVTAGAFGWTCWQLVDSLQVLSLRSLAISIGWFVLCLVSWMEVARVVLHYHRKSRESAKVYELNKRLLEEAALLRMVLDQLPDCIYAKDRQGRFAFNNLSHIKNLGAELPQQLRGKSDFDYFPNELATQFFNDEQKIIASGVPIINQEQFKRSIACDPGSQKRWMVASKVPWRDRRGQIVGTVGITRDIHELKQTQEVLRQSEERLRLFTARLEHSNRELQDFAYVASHDLQEPLRKIVVFGDRLKEKLDTMPAMDPEARDYLERMQKAASRMQTLISDLLNFSRVTTKAQPFAPVDLKTLASEVVADLEGRIEQVKGRVEIGPLPTIEAEALQMRQLLQNLIGNALKFHRPEESPVVTVEARIFSGRLPQSAADTPDEPLCELTVSDNGIGFDEKYLDRIFNVFQRLHARGLYDGTGMGLAIARKIVLYHGGDITAQSKPGHGARFKVVLPVAHPKDADNL
jgi:PAS domain S-box-containing protein